jgi:hypothetical protein
VAHDGLVLNAYIDESGILNNSPTAPDHFIMAAVVWRDSNAERAHDVLSALRNDLRRPPGQYLSFKDIRPHNDRLRLSDVLGQQTWLKIVSVVVRKRHLPGNMPSIDHSYLYTLRYMLERLSWLAAEHDEICSYTLAQINSLELSKLREYENALRRRDTAINWQNLDAKGGSIDQPKRREELQLADLAASSIGRAFNGDKPWNYTEPAYVINLARRFYCKRGGRISSYGLKLHPARDEIGAAYPWIAALCASAGVKP